MHSLLVANWERCGWREERRSRVLAAWDFLSGSLVLEPTLALIALALETIFIASCTFFRVSSLDSDSKMDSTNLSSASSRLSDSVQPQEVVRHH
ncbi:hypothetical protein NL676_001691 [Syzygium grande]|nr:hypothetical protein NL676_001691 [Syzygium grande]